MVAADSDRETERQAMRARRRRMLMSDFDNIFDKVGRMRKRQHGFAKQLESKNKSIRV